MDIEPTSGQQNESGASTDAEGSSPGQPDEAWIRMVAEEGYRVLFGLDDPYADE